MINLITLVFQPKFISNEFNNSANRVYFKLMNNYFTLVLQNSIINFFDLLYLTVISNFYTKHNNSFFYSQKRIKWRLLNTKVGFFFNFSPKYTFSAMNFLWFGFYSLWKHISYWFLSLLLGLVIFYGLVVIKNVHLIKISFQWLCIVMFVYWLLSGFSFFLKKYKTSKFTTVIQRFWRRTYILFWLIETSVFVTFLYLTINSSQEPFYMYDQIKCFKTHLFSWRYFLIKIITIAVLIVFGNFCLLNLKWGFFNKQSIFLFSMTLFLTYIVWLEFYQFFHVINYYGSLVWNFDLDERIWVLDVEYKRTRIVNNYVALCLLAKFWHLIFIYVFWVFFIIRSNEIKRYRYPLLSANLQNFIILYTMSWIYMYPWFKFGIRKYLDYSYYWFFVNSRSLWIRVFFNDLKLFFFGFLSYFDCFILKKYHQKPFYYWHSANYFTTNYNYRKHYIRDFFLYNIFI